jgi:hypothetical protein
LTERQKRVTQWLFWGAFGIFLAVSIPHVAWVVDQYEPHRNNNPLIGFFYGMLALGYAIAIDGIMAWLTHVQSSGMGPGRNRWDKGMTWMFIIALVAMSWYLNWVYNLAHDPSGQSGDVWRFGLTNPIGAFPALTVGNFTPVLLAALPVFTIAYVSILNRVNAMKAQNAKSVEQLEQEATEAERRAIAMRHIRNAGRTVDATGKVVTGVFGLAKKVREEAKDFAGEKKDPYTIMLEKIIAFFKDTPELLQNASQANIMIKDLLKVKNLQQADMWRVKAVQKLAQLAQQEEEVPSETVQRDDEQMPSEERNTETDLPAFLEDQNERHHEIGYNAENVFLYNAENVFPDDAQNAMQTTEQLGLTGDILEIVKRYPKSIALLSSGDSTAPLEVISEVTGHGLKRLKNVTQRGFIRHTSRNENIVFIDSVLQWLKTAPVPRQNEGQTGRLSALKLTELQN